VALGPRARRWLVSRRARDLSLLHREGVLDPTSLAYGLYHHTDRAPDTNIILEAQPATNLLLSRALDRCALAGPGALQGLRLVRTRGARGVKGGQRALTPSPPRGDPVVAAAAAW
jgi:hypothetical protein